MWRNKEFRTAVAMLAFLDILALVITVAYEIDLWWMLVLFLLLSNAVFFFYTIRRYRDIQKLSVYLMQVYAGKDVLDIRDNMEGELSILKNDIYKVTQTLHEQAQLLRKDRTYLVDTLSDISHQLKTPLTSLHVLCDLLQEQELPQEKKQEFLHQMHTQLERMQWLIVSLLRLSRIDANAVTFKKETIMLKELLLKSLQPFLVLMELKGIHQELHCDENVCINGDENWLVEAFSNVVKNAVEHTYEQGRLLLVCEDNPLHTRITITNEGPEIEQEDLQHLFERFYKGKNAGSDSIGIGLALSRSILQNQNAQIECISMHGETSFIITFYKHSV